MSMGSAERAAARWASYEEAGRLYGLSRWTLWRWAKAGNIRVARVGSVVRVDVASVERFLEMRADDFG
jgi:excisionase family DNA binding protein